MISEAKDGASGETTAPQAKEGLRRPTALEAKGRLQRPKDDSTAQTTIPRAKGRLLKGRLLKGRLYRPKDDPDDVFGLTRRAWGGLDAKRGEVM